MALHGCRAAPEGFGSIPYLRAPHETQIGLTTWDRQERPRAVQFRKFQRMAAQLDLEGLAPAPAEAGIVVPDEWAKPFGDLSRFGLSGPAVLPFVSTQGDGAAAGRQTQSGAEENLSRPVRGCPPTSWRHAGLKADFPREYDGWQRRPALFVPSPLTSPESNLVHVPTDFWNKARKYFEGGGFLYASLSADAAIPGMEEIFGAAGRSGDLTLKVVEKLGRFETRRCLAGGEMRQWPATLAVRGGTVVAVDQAGRPALVAHSAGAGKTLMCARFSRPTRRRWKFPG